MKLITLLPYLASLLIGAGGTALLTKATRPKIEIKTEKVEPPPCPPCPAAVTLQGFDVSKFNNKKGNLHYSPQLHNVTVHIGTNDTLLVRMLAAEMAKTILAKK